MIHFKTLASLIAVLLAVVPVTPKDTPPKPDDPAALPVDPPEEFPDDDEPDAPTAGRPGLGAPTAGKKPITDWRECALRCKKKCVDKYNSNNCATKFVSNRCQLFPPKLANTALTKCLGAIDCENSGMKVCENNLECLREDQCCLEGQCNDGYRCVNHWCAAKGLPSFTVTWAGMDDLDLHVITPNGDDLNYELDGEEDPDSGGQFQHDDDPEWLFGAKTFQETVYFPLDGSAPGGPYEYYVYNGHTESDPAKTFTIYVYEGDAKVATKRGRVENGAEATHYTYDYMPPEE